MGYCYANTHSKVVIVIYCSSTFNSVDENSMATYYSGYLYTIHNHPLVDVSIILIWTRAQFHTSAMWNSLKNVYTGFKLKCEEYTTNNNYAM